MPREKIYTVFGINAFKISAFPPASPRTYNQSAQLTRTTITYRLSRTATVKTTSWAAREWR